MVARQEGDGWHRKRGWRGADFRLENKYVRWMKTIGEKRKGRIGRKPPKAELVQSDVYEICLHLFFPCVRLPQWIQSSSPAHRPRGPEDRTWDGRLNPVEWKLPWASRHVLLWVSNCSSGTWGYSRNICLAHLHEVRETQRKKTDQGIALCAVMKRRLGNPSVLPRLVLVLPLTCDLGKVTKFSKLPHL